MKKELALLGPVSLDFNIEPDGHLVREVGGAIVYSAFAAAVTDCDSIILAKGNPREVDFQALYAGLASDWRVLAAACTTSIENRYLDLSHERRISRVKAQTESFSLAELDALNLTADTYYLGGLMYGDFPDTFIEGLTAHGKIALDAQCLLRHGDLKSGAMTFHDWSEKTRLLPCLTYLKVDANEAEILTGLTDRRAAAQCLFSRGAREVFVSYHTEMMVYDGKFFYRCAYQPASLAGRTGRGDSVFAAYVGSRRRNDIATALRFATALTARKMEKPGPYRGDAVTVERYAATHGLRVVKEKSKS